MNTDRYMHDVNLGEPLGLDVLKDHLEDDRIRAILQHIRNKSAGCDRKARISPTTNAQVNPQNPLEYRASHSGGANELEKLFWELLEPGRAEDAEPGRP